MGRERALRGGVVRTGGGAQMPGMCDVAERVLNCQAGKGLPIGIRDWPEEMDQPEWTTVAGLAMYSARLQQQNAAAKQSLGILGRLLN